MLFSFRKMKDRKEPCKIKGNQNKDKTREMWGKFKAYKEV